MDFLTLIESGKHTAIVSYVKSCKYLGTDEELALISRGNHEEIMAYIAHHYFDVESFEAFLKRGCLNEIRFYLANNFLYEGTERDILALGRGMTDVFVDCLLSYCRLESSPWSEETWAEVESALIEAGDHCALRRYIYLHPLVKKAYDVLKVQGTAEDLLVYDLLWKGSCRKISYHNWLDSLKNE